MKLKDARLVGVSTHVAAAHWPARAPVSNRRGKNAYATAEAAPEETTGPAGAVAPGAGSRVSTTWIPAAG
jgi:hypothetical protein